MFIINCPYCGERDQSEFKAGGEAHIERPKQPTELSDDEWAEYLFMRKNIKGVQYEETSYEGYGPGGVAIFMEVMTDNKNRTVGELRATLGKNGGNMGENGCVAWIFEQKGLITVKMSEKGEEELLELAIDAGADDMQTIDDYYEITTSVESFEPVRKAIEDAGIKTQ